jgi:deoxyribodipyrimidine photo-lyase
VQTALQLGVIDVVWFKRDLRTHDHLPLLSAAGRGAVLPLYVIEPSMLQSPDFAPRHYHWTRQSLIELRRSLAELGAPLVVRVGEVIEILKHFHETLGIARLWSHEETGNGLTFARDIAVKNFCASHRIVWTEQRQFGVIRRMRSRDGWARKWEAFMTAPEAAAVGAIRPVPGVDPGPIPTADQLKLPPDDITLDTAPGESAGLNTIDSFLSRRGKHFGREISSPLTAITGGSRLSSYLAYGNVSLKRVVQQTRLRLAELEFETDGKQWRRSLRSFESRLHWHCHFIQKLESDPRIEHENFVRAFDTLRPVEPDAERLTAWKSGRTGYPMIDAVMRCLQQTGWINFRMRSMVVSFSSYHLWQHWQQPALHLARMFVDYEPGIHYSQMQMQSGTTGINTLRIYSPTKQAIDQDPQGLFIRRWVPELSRVPSAYIHEPWKMHPGLQRDTACEIGRDYPKPIVDHSQAVTLAKERFTPFRKAPITRKQADAVNDKHGSRKSGMRQIKRHRAPKKVDDSPGLFS